MDLLMAIWINGYLDEQNIYTYGWRDGCQYFVYFVIIVLEEACYIFAF